MLKGSPLSIPPSLFLKKKELQAQSPEVLFSLMCDDEASGIRTPDNLIKSQVLYRLS